MLFAGADACRSKEPCIDGIKIGRIHLQPRWVSSQQHGFWTLVIVDIMQCWTGLCEYGVSIGRQSQRTVETKVIGGKVLTAVARVAERNVAALLTTTFSPVQDGRCACDGRHDGKRDAYSQTCTAARLFVVHCLHVRLIIVVQLCCSVQLGRRRADWPTAVCRHNKWSNVSVYRCTNRDT